MRLISLARRPLSEGSVTGNVARWGCGGFDIDSNRISCAEGHSPAADRRNTARKSGNFSISGRKAAESVSIGRLDYRGSFETRAAFRPSELLGRWPANLLLQHDLTCQNRGIKIVKGSPSSSILHNAYEGTSTTGFIRGVSHSGNQHGDSTGKEAVAVWNCDKMCPISVLDSQSGVSFSGGVRVQPARVGRAMEIQSVGLVGVQVVSKTLERLPVFSSKCRRRI